MTTPPIAPDSLDAWRRVEADLEPLRQRLRERHDQIALRLQRHDAGLDLARWLCGHLDQTLLLLRDLLALHDCPPPEVAIFATGGYGMGLICPRSDIDLLAVYDPQRADMAALARWSGGFQTALSDLGLRVGLAHRAPDECLQLARQDLSIATSMLEARPLWGMEHIHHLGWGDDTLNDLIANDLRAKDGGRAFTRDLLNTRLANHKRSGQTVFLLEPDIKSGRGGMRDLHALLWSAHVLFGARGLHATAATAAANQHEVDAFCDAADLLYRVRAALHHNGARFGNDRLTFQHQEKLADLLIPQPPQPDRDTLLPVEHFMQRFYVATDTLANLSLRALRLWLLPESDPRPVLVSPGVCVRQGHVDLVRNTDQPDAAELVPTPEPDALEPHTSQNLTNPTASLDNLAPEADHLLLHNPVSLYEAALDLNLPLHPVVEAHLSRVVREHTHPDGGPSYASLRRLLCSQDTPDALVQSMARCGLLRWLLHELQPITGLAQHDIYHVYTVDAHLRLSLELGRAALRGNIDGYGHTWEALRELASRVPSHRREVFLLACLLHDVGKGRNKDHSIFGAQLAALIGPRLQLSDNQTRHLQLLIREHLLLPRVSQRRDINDDEAIRKVALSVRSVAALEDLTLLAAVDMMAVAPGNLTEWKAQLLVSLYQRVRHVLEEGLDVLWRRNEEVARRKAQILATLEAEELAAPLLDEARARVEEFFSALPESYLLRTAPRALARHARLFASGQDIALELAPSALAGCTEVILVTRAHPNALATLSGILAAESLTILNAQTWRMDGDRTLAVCLVQTAAGQKISDARRVDRLHDRILAALRGDVSLDDLLTRRGSSLDRPAPGVPTVLRIDQEPNRPHTVLEVQTRDRLGLLWRITRTLHDAGCRVHFAKIATEGARAIDSFYIDRAADPHGPLTEHEVDALRQRLTRALEDHHAD